MTSAWRPLRSIVTIESSAEAANRGRRTRGRRSRARGRSRHLAGAPARRLGAPLPHPDRQDDDLDPGELQPALDRERRLPVERAREEVLALEHQLAREHHRTAELLD